MQLWAVIWIFLLTGLYSAQCFYILGNNAWFKAKKSALSKQPAYQRYVLHSTFQALQPPGEYLAISVRFCKIAPGGCPLFFIWNTPRSVLGKSEHAQNNPQIYALYVISTPVWNNYPEETQIYVLWTSCMYHPCQELSSSAVIWMDIIPITLANWWDYSTFQIWSSQQQVSNFWMWKDT